MTLARKWQTLSYSEEDATSLLKQRSTYEISCLSLPNLVPILAGSECPWCTDTIGYILHKPEEPSTVYLPEMCLTLIPCKKLGHRKEVGYFTRNFLTGRAKSGDDTALIFLDLGPTGTMKQQHPQFIYLWNVQQILKRLGPLSNWPCSVQCQWPAW